MKHRAVRLATLALIAIAAAALGDAAAARPPIYNPVTLNIGLNCQWQQRCIADQQRAMKRSLKYVAKYQPATWRVELCNHNAGRKYYRVDWVGYYNCIRNTNLLPLPARVTKAPARAVKKKRVRRITESSPTTPSLGERGR